MADLIGLSIGRYHILEQLGKGGMATVYKAYDTNLERDVAVKVIRRNAFPEEQLDQILKRFEREAKALARLSHPNIVGIIDYGDYEGAPYLVMEYLPGGTLKQRLGKPMPWLEAVRILLPIAQALDYAHNHHIVHRDIKPSNVLLTENAQPMLSDFGIAKILEGEDSQALTTTGMGMGTPEYMSPEQWTGQAGPLSDLYSLGVVLYELVTGHKPYTADTPAAILLKQTSEPLPRPTQYVPDLPDAVEKLLIKALAIKPADRYKDMAAMASAMDALLLGSATTQVEVQAAQTLMDVPATVYQGGTVDQLKAQAVQPKPAAPPAPVRQAARPAVPVAKSGTPAWKKLGIPGIIVVVLTCICLLVVGVLAYMGMKGTGPLKMLATATLTPTRTPTRTPTQTPTQAPEASLAGEWELSFSWDCTGNYTTGSIVFFEDFTFNINDDPSLWGTWYMDGEYVDFTFDEEPYSHYTGMIYYPGDYMDGTMDNVENLSGCWYASRATTDYAAADEFVGDWDFYSDWGCTGTYTGPDAITVNSDFSFSAGGTTLGYWGSSAEYVDFLFSDPPYSDYAGTISSDGMYMEGTMSDSEGGTGCWYATKTSTTDMAGTWQDPETKDVFVIVWQNGQYEVTSVTWEGTTYEVTEQSWSGSSLTWTYYIPENDMYLSYETTSLSGDLLYTNWWNSGGNSGTETLERIP